MYASSATKELNHPESDECNVFDKQVPLVLVLHGLGDHMTQKQKYTYPGFAKYVKIGNRLREHTGDNYLFTKSIITQLSF